MRKPPYWGVVIFVPDSALHICHVVRYGHFTLNQLRLSVVSEVHTNSYTGPRLLHNHILK